MLCRARFTLVAIVSVTEVVPATPEPHPRNDATPSDYELEWSAPNECPSADAIRARITALLSGPPQGNGTASITAEVQPVDGGYRLSLVTRFQAAIDERSVVASTCADVAESTALVVAVALEPGLSSTYDASLLARSPRSSELEDEARATAIPDRTATPSPALARPNARAAGGSAPEVAVQAPAMEVASRSPAIADEPAMRTVAKPDPFMGLAVLGEFGMFGALEPGFQGAVGVGWTRSELRLEGRYWVPRVVAPNGVGAREFAALFGTPQPLARGGCTRVGLGSTGGSLAIHTGPPSRVSRQCIG